METKDLTRFVLMIVLIGMVIGIGILTFDKFGDATSETTTVANESVTVTAGAGSLAGYNILTVTSFADNQSTLTSGILTSATITWDTTAGSFVVNTSNPTLNWTAANTYYVYYTYDKNSTTTDTMGDVRSAVTPIASTWLPLVVTVVILAIILGIVLNSFAKRR